jgi:excinuclease ABC subunit C
MFLEGRRPKYLEELKTAMREAASAHAFEKAAALRDTWFRIADAVRQSKRMTASPALRAEDAMNGARELGRLLDLGGDALVIEAFDVSNISGTYAVASMVCAVNGVPQGNRYRRFRIRTEGGNDDTAMIGEAVRRRYGRLAGEGKSLPDLVLVDGGVTQVAAARRELDGLGLTDLRVAGLAKRIESIHLAGSSSAMVLPRDTAALRVLQRLRDEAHRFALAYHLRLRNRRIRDSVLDEIPGIGGKRKQRLLAEFKSVAGMRRATEDEIARVPGIGYDMACVIKRALTRPQGAGEHGTGKTGDTGGETQFAG